MSYGEKFDSRETLKLRTDSAGKHGLLITF